MGYMNNHNVSPFDEQTLNWCLKGLLKNDLLKDEKKVILEEFLKDKVARGEVCDVLNMQYADLGNWSWDAEESGLPIEPRRQANGKYRVMMDEDVLQAIFLHYIGMKWSSSMKNTLKDLIRYTRIWKTDVRLPQGELDRRRYYLGEWRTEQEVKGGLEQERQQMYSDDLFLSMLPSAIWEGAGGYDDEEDEDTGGQPKRKSPREIRQQLLRQFATELNIHQTLDGSAAIVQSDFQWFATSISHSTIAAVLRFAGVSDEWILFFKKFLEAPLDMSPVSEHSAPTKARIRRRGVPMAHALEKFFGEIILFFMDLAVKQQADTLLYRYHDDLWLCGKPERCAKGWKTMEEFASVMGLDFNIRKTGSVYLTNDGIAKDAEVLSKLPSGPVSVGFLALDPQTGTWIIDQKEVDTHITVLQKQLAKCTSILSWVQTWNSCIGRFFSHSFADPANCFGIEHVDSILRTHRRMQKIIFNGKDGNGRNITEHLKGLIAERFGVSDIPDAFIFMPEQLGGLAVRNPFIASFLHRDRVENDPKGRMKEFLVQEKEAYEAAKREFEEKGERERRRSFHTIFTEEYGDLSNLVTVSEEERDTFMSIEEYTRWRDVTSSRLTAVYKYLMQVARQKEVTISTEVKEALEELATSQPELNLKDLDAETKWLLQLHSKELFERCGDLSMVDKNLLPLGILTILRKKRVTWQMVL